MPYVGRDLSRGNYLKLDDLVSQFNGSKTTFNLTSGGSAFFPGSAFSILVSLGGIIQEPESAYTINKSQITFASAPLATDEFFIIALGVALGVGVPGHGTVNGSQLASPIEYDNYFYLDSANNRVGIHSATPTVALDVIGDIKLNGSLVTGGGGGFNAGVVTCTGLDVNGNADFSGNVSIGGTLTYLDVTNIDSVGIITAQSDVEFHGTGAGISSAFWDKSANEFKFKDNVKLSFGDSQDLSIYHDGSYSYVKDAGTGDLVLQGTNNVWLQHGNGENALKATQDAGVEIRFNNLPKISTIGYGVTVFGTTETQKLNVTGISTFGGASTFNSTTTHNEDVTFTGANFNALWDKSKSALILNNDTQINFGTNEDGDIYHDSTQMIVNNATGNLKLRSSSIHIAGNSNEKHIVSTTGVGVTVYYNDSAKFQSTNTGAQVLGQLDLESAGSYIKSNQLKFNPSGHAYIDHGVVAKDISFRLSKSSSLDQTMLQMDADGEITKFHKVISVGLQGGNDTAVVGGGSGIGAYLQLNHASTGANTKLMGNANSWLNANHGNLAIGTAANTAIHASGIFNGATPKLEIKLGTASNSYKRLINITNPGAQTGSETLGRVGIKLSLGSEASSGESNKSGIIYAESTSGYNNGTALCFATSNTEKLRISSTGQVLIGETSVAGGSQKLVIGQGGAENFEFTPGVSTQNGGVLEYIHRGDGSTRPDLSMYVGGGAFKVYTGGNNERLHISNSYARAGIGTNTFDGAGSQLKIEGRGTGTTTPPMLQIKGVGSGVLHSYVDLIATSDNNPGNSYRGLGVVMLDEPTNVEWFSGRPYAGSDAYIIGRKASPSYRTQSGESANQFLRINSSGRLLLGPDAQDIQIIPHSTASGHGQIYLRGNASNETSSIKLNHYGHADYVIAVGRYTATSTNGLFSITRTDGGTDGLIMNTSGKVSIGKAPETLTGHGVNAKLQVNTGASDDYSGIMIGGGYTRSTIQNGATYDLILTSNAYPANATSKGIRFKCGTNGGGGPHERMRIHQSGMSEWRQHGGSKTYEYRSSVTGTYNQCIILADPHNYHSFSIEVDISGYAYKYVWGKYYGYMNGGLYAAGNPGHQDRYSSSQYITHSNPTGNKHQFLCYISSATHPQCGIKITVGGPDAYIDDGDITFTWS